MISVRQHRVSKAEEIRYMLPDVGTLHTDGQDLRVQLLKAWIIFLQLDELRPAGASSSGPIEQQDDILVTLV